MIFEHRGKTSTTFDSLISKYITKRGSKSDGSTGVSSVQLTNSANTRKTSAIDSINTIVDRVRTNILAGKNRLVIENTLNNNSTCNSNSGGNGKCWWVTPKKWNMLHWSAYTNNYDMVNYLLLGKLGGGVQKLKKKNSFTSQQQITSAPSSSSSVNGVDGVYGGSPELLSRNDAFGCAPIHLAARSDSVHALRHMCMAVQKIEKHSTRMTKKNSTNEKEQQKNKTAFSSRSSKRVQQQAQRRWTRLLALPICELSPSLRSLLELRSSNGYTVLHHAAAGGSLLCTHWLMRNHPSLCLDHSLTLPVIHTGVRRSLLQMDQTHPHLEYMAWCNAGQRSFTRLANAKEWRLERLHSDLALLWLLTKKKKRSLTIVDRNSQSPTLFNAGK